MSLVGSRPVVKREIEIYYGPTLSQQVFRVIELLNKNADGTPKTLKWGDISGDIQTTNHNLSAYNIQWMRKNSLVVMNDPNQEITEGTYVVYAIPNTPNPSAYQPQAAGEIDAAAIPAINVDQTNPAPVDVRLNYVITDLQGKVIKVVVVADAIDAEALVILTKIGRAHV